MFWVLLVIGLVVLTIILSNKEWVYQYDNYKILVKNTASSCVVLVNDKQIAKGHMFTHEILGKLDKGEEIKVKLNPWGFTLKCSLYVEDEKIYPSERGSLSGSASDFARKNEVSSLQQALERQNEISNMLLSGKNCGNCANRLIYDDCTYEGRGTAPAGVCKRHIMIN